MSTGVGNIVDFARREGAKERMTRVREHELPPVVMDLVEEYETFEGARDTFVWQWVHQLAPEFTLPSVAPEYAERVRADKTIATLFITLLDDALEERRDRATFEEAAKVPFPHQSVAWDRPDVDADYVAFAERVWETLAERLDEAPEHGTYEEYLRYDLKQAINAIDYSYLVIQRPEVATLHELSIYESHNMMMYAYADIDLMHSPPLPDEELPRLRKAVWCAQRMARIGNWVSTWERELREGDYSSGVLVYALRNGIVDETELRLLRETGCEDTYSSIVERIKDSQVEELFLTRWEVRYEELSMIGSEMNAIELSPYVEGMKEVLRYHLASKGLK